MHKINHQLVYEMAKEAGLTSFLFKGVRHLPKAFQGKGAGTVKWLSRRSRFAPTTTGIGNLSKGVKPVTQKGENFKGIFVRKNPVGVREVSKGQLVHEGRRMGFLNPKSIAEKTVGGVKDLAAPFRTNDPFGTKLKNFFKNQWHDAKFKHGKTYIGADGKAYQNVYERTIGGKALAGGFTTTVGMTGLSYATSDEKHQGKRIAKSIGQGLMWGPVGMAAAGPVMMGHMGYQGYKAYKGAKQGNQTGHIGAMNQNANNFYQQPQYHQQQRYF